MTASVSARVVGSLSEASVQDSTRQRLQDAGLDVTAAEDVVRRALDEDLGDVGDITTLAIVSSGDVLRASFVSRSQGIVAGLPLLPLLFDLVGRDGVMIDACVADGATVATGTVLAVVTAPARTLLTAERTALNLLGHLSGIATVTRQWVEEVAGTGARVRDTRKTTPGLRDLEKYAVRCGGGVNHRIGLFDAYLVKDNHVAAAGGVVSALERIRAHALDVAEQVEVDDLSQLSALLPHKPESVLLDNFSVDQLREAVRMARAEAPDIALEASGGLTLNTAREVAETGVDFLAVGALTHSAPQLDIGLDIIAGG